jgi:hypothetical protein
MTQKDIRIGIVGANSTASWAKISHIPAIQSLRGVKLAAVATRNRCLPLEGLPRSCGRDVVRSGHDEVAPISLRRVWRNRDWYWLAIPLPIDTGTGPASGAPFGPDDLPGSR